MPNDGISDMLARIKNGYGARLGEIVMPWSKAKEKLAQVLKNNHFISDLSVKEEDKKKYLTLKLTTVEKNQPLFDFKRVSKPSLRRYVNKTELPTVLGGFGIAVISTPAGLMTAKEARKRGLGGEIWCEVW